MVNAVQVVPIFLSTCLWANVPFSRVARDGHTEASAPSPTPAQPSPEGDAYEYPVLYDHGKDVDGGYQSPRSSCHIEERITFKDVCVDYDEETCSTQFEETCVKVPYKNCNGIVSSTYEQACFDVDELICGLKEEVEYETVVEDSYAQLCTIVNERVCDTTFDIAVHPFDDFQCVELDGQSCEDQETVINDVVCKKTSDFDCRKVKSRDSYGQSTVCTPVPVENCYETPRVIRTEVCRPDNTRFCEKFTNGFPQPQQKQNCHFEPKKVCEMQRRTQPKKAKKFSYTPDCQVVRRKLCDQVEKKAVQPVCTEAHRRQCEYTPKESCSKELKQHCYKQEVKVQEEVCDDKIQTIKL